MKFNVAKCHSMRVTRHQHHKQIHFDYSLHNQTLENVQSAKYLSITITDDMDWGQHVSEISSKATKTLGFLRRNLAFAPRSTKEVAYKTLVRPKLDYAAPIWSQHSKLQINQIEKVQRTAPRWTCRRWRNTSSVGEMLDELEWPSVVVVVSGIQPEKAQTPKAWERPATLASDIPRPLYGQKTPKKLVGFNVSF